MTSPADSTDAGALRRFLPEASIGEVTAIEPIRAGLSGAGVYAVTAESGAYVLRVQGDAFDDSTWRQHLTLLRRAAEHRVAPALVHVDESARAIVSRRVTGVPLPIVLADPGQRQNAIVDVVSRLRAIHEIDRDGIGERDAVEFARCMWESQRRRADFPPWAIELELAFDRLAALLRRDRRRVVSHNDVNPGNVLWDGTRSWLVDWEVAGLNHPYYDLAAFVTFLDLPPERADALLELQEQSSVDAEAHAMLAGLRQLVALAVGNIFLSMVPDLSAFAAPTRARAPTLADCRAAMRAGGLDLQTTDGRAKLGLAFLRIGTEE